MLLQPVGLRRATSGEPSPAFSSSSSSLGRSQLSAMTPPRSTRSVSTAVLRVRPAAKGSAARVSQPLRAAPDGIAIGTAAPAAFYCLNDPMVSPEHGTLECTAKLGVWVYVDHSAHGSTLNGSQRLLRDAAVVRTGDRLLVGATEIELRFEKPPAAVKEDARQPAGSSARGGIAPSPIEWAGGKLDAAFSRSDRPTALASVKSFTGATPPQHSASPAPGFNPRRKRHSMTAFTPTLAPPPPPLGVASSTQFLFQRTRPLVPSAPSTPPRADTTRPCAAVSISPHQSPGHPRRRSNQAPDEAAAAKPPPLGYSSSPVAGPSQPPQIPQSPSPRLVPQKQLPRVADAPKSQRDDLRRRVLKKMDQLQETKRDGRPVPSHLQIPMSLTPRAAAAPSSGGAGASFSAAAASLTARQRVNNNQLDFTPPSSPVAHKDLLRQKASLLNILKHKYKEEQLLKQQQEEWMRRNLRLATSTPPVSPIKSKARNDDDANDVDDDVSGDDGGDDVDEHQRSRRRPHTNHDDDDDDGAEMSDLEIPPRAPVLHRTTSLGIHHASPRLTAAVLASRARLGSCSNQRSPTAASHDSADLSSVSSSVSTERACHRRVTRSLSQFSSKEDEDEDFAAQSTAVHDFLGYEDDDAADALTSFTAHGFYASDDCKSSPKDAKLFSAFYASPPSGALSSSSSSLVLTGSASKDRFVVEIVTPREPEDDELLESPKRPCPKPQAAASPNFFDKTRRRSLYTPAARFSPPSDVDPVSSSAAAARASSPSAIRSSRRQASPV